MLAVDIRERASGPLPLRPDVRVTLPDRRTTVRDLIERAVAAQLAAAGAPATGVPAAGPEVAAEVRRACAAFTRGAFVVFVGGAQRDGLDEPFDLADGATVTFLRLTALAGG